MSYPTPYPAPPPRPPAPGEQRRPVDVTVTIVLLVLTGILTTVLVVGGALVAALGGISAANGQGDGDEVGQFFAVVVVIPLVLYVAALVGALVQMSRRRTSWYFPVAATVIAFVVAVVGYPDW